MFPEAADAEPAQLSSEDLPRLTKELSLLGFTAVQARNAITALSQPSPLTSSLLGRLPPLQACIEFLILQVPECDLPKRFLPTANSSNPFVTSAHAGTDDLKKRWIEDKAVKECGWPAHIVKECTSDPTLTEDWGKLIFALNCRLVGVDWKEACTIDAEELEELDEDEVESLGGKRGANQELIIPLPVAPLSLHLIVPEDRTIPCAITHPPMYITSSSVAAYVRLHILAKLIAAFKTGTLREPVESMLMAIMRLVEEEWAAIEDDGPPSISEALQNLLPRTAAPVSTEDATGDAHTLKSSSRKRARPSHRDDRTDLRVKEDLQQLQQRSDYTKMLAAREKLPAFASRSDFLNVLKSSRCVVVVGETGTPLHSA